MEQEHILVIDDEEGLLQLVKMRLTAMGFAVTACTSGRDAVSAAKTNRFDLAITDLRRVRDVGTSARGVEEREQRVGQYHQPAA